MRAPTPRCSYNLCNGGFSRNFYVNIEVVVLLLLIADITDLSSANEHDITSVDDDTMETLSCFCL